MLEYLWESFKIGWNFWTGIVTGLSTILGIVYFLVCKRYPKAKLSKKYYGYALGLVGLFLLLGTFRGSYQKHKSVQDDLERAEKTKELFSDKNEDGSLFKTATPDQLVGTYFNDLDIRISDLVRDSPLIQNRIFINCRFFGPAVVSATNCTMTGNTIGVHENEGKLDINSVYIPFDGKRSLQGIIFMNRVTLKGCAFKNISFIGDNKFKEEFFSAMRTSQ